MNPDYANLRSSSHVCIKIARRLKDFLVKYDQKGINTTRRFAVIVGTGSYNPLTRMHIRNFFLAKQYLENNTDMVVLGSLLSPAHSSLVRQRYRACPLENIPAPHRLAIAQLCVQDSKWLSIDPWEITRRRSMDYSSLLDHCNDMLQCNFPNVEIRLMYLCKASNIPLLSPTVLKAGNCGVVSVCRVPESDNIRKSLGRRWNGLAYIAEDDAILDSTMDIVSSKKVRNRLKANENVAHLVGSAISEYMHFHMVAEKMSGVEEWDEDEKLLPKITASHMKDASEVSSSNLSTVSQAVHSPTSTLSVNSAYSIPPRLSGPDSDVAVAKISDTQAEEGENDQKEGEGEEQEEEEATAATTATATVTINTSFAPLGNAPSSSSRSPRLELAKNTTSQATVAVAGSR